MPEKIEVRKYKVRLVRVEEDRVKALIRCDANYNLLLEDINTWINQSYKMGLKDATSKGIL